MRDRVLCLYSFVRPGLVQVDLVEIKKLSSKIKVPRYLALNRFGFSSFRTLLSLLFWWFIWIWAFELVLARWICARILEEHVYRLDLVVSSRARSLGILTKVEKTLILNEIFRSSWYFGVVYKHPREHLCKIWAQLDFVWIDFTFLEFGFGVLNLPK